MVSCLEDCGCRNDSRADHVALGLQFGVACEKKRDSLIFQPNGDRAVVSLIAWFDKFIGGMEHSNFDLGIERDSPSASHDRFFEVPLEHRPHEVQIFLGFGLQSARHQYVNRDFPNQFGHAPDVVGVAMSCNNDVEGAHASFLQHARQKPGAALWP